MNALTSIASAVALAGTGCVPEADRISDQPDALTAQDQITGRSGRSFPRAWRHRSN